MASQVTAGYTHDIYPLSGRHSCARRLADDLLVRAGAPRPSTEPASGRSSANCCRTRLWSIAPHSRTTICDERTGDMFSVQRRRCQFIRVRCATQLRVGCSRRVHGNREDEHRSVGSPTQERIQPVSMGCRARTAWVFKRMARRRASERVQQWRNTRAGEKIGPRPPAIVLIDALSTILVAPTVVRIGRCDRRA
jgi:hypothetical protein